MTMKSGCGNLFCREPGGGLYILMIGQKIMQKSFWCYTKRKQDQKKCRGKTSYNAGMFQNANLISLF
jgi:hypothetical protein